VVLSLTLALAGNRDLQQSQADKTSRQTADTPNTSFSKFGRLLDNSPQDGERIFINPTISDKSTHGDNSNSLDRPTHDKLESATRLDNLDPKFGAFYPFKAKRENRSQGDKEPDQQSSNKDKPDSKVEPYSQKKPSANYKKDIFFSNEKPYASYRKDILLAESVRGLARATSYVNFISGVEDCWSS
jgi:hypothetical protein